jgi:hypothetical protein
MTTTKRERTPAIKLEKGLQSTRELMTMQMCSRAAEAMSITA